MNTRGRVRQPEPSPSFLHLLWLRPPTQAPAATPLPPPPFLLTTWIFPKQSATLHTSPASLHTSSIGVNRLERPKQEAPHRQASALSQPPLPLPSAQRSPYSARVPARQPWVTPPMTDVQKPGGGFLLLCSRQAPLESALLLAPLTLLR